MAATVIGNVIGRLVWKVSITETGILQHSDS